MYYVVNNWNSQHRWYSDWNGQLYIGMLLWFMGESAYSLNIVVTVEHYSPALVSILPQAAVFDGFLLDEIYVR